MTEPQQQPPASAAEAQQRLDTLKADGAWSERFLAGDGSANKEFQDLTAQAAGSMLDNAMAGITPGDIPSSDQRRMTETASMLREIGFHEQAIRETLEGKPASAAEVALAKTAKAQKMNSPEWVKRFLAGEPAERLQMTAINAVLSSPIAQEQSK